MAEFNSGMSEVRKFTRTLELLSKAVKNLAENHRDMQHYKNFEKQLVQTDPKNPVMNESNTVFYDVTGVGPTKMGEVLDAAKIPHAAFLDPKTGTSVVAVPKQFELQANLILAKSNELKVTPAQLLPKDAAMIKKMVSNMMQTPSALVMASIQNGTAVTKTFDSARWMPLAQQMEKDGIPFAVMKNSKDGTTSLIFDQQYLNQVQGIDLRIEKAKPPAELSYAEFMQKNLGQNIVERSGLSEGQLKTFRDQMRGSCAEYNVQRQNNGMYTIRYNAKQAAYIEPVMTHTLVLTNGVNAQGQPLRSTREGEMGPVDRYADYVRHQAEMAYTAANNGKQMVIADATRTDARGNLTYSYLVTDKGLLGHDGKLIVSKNDPKFAATVHSVTSQMKAPVVHEAADGERPSIGLCQRDEIQRAKAAHADAVPSDASIMAAQIATLKVTHELSQPNASVEQCINNTANFMQNLANGIEEESFRLDPEELKDEPTLHGPEKPEKVVEFEDTVHKLQPAEKSALSEGMRRTSNELAGGITARAVSKNDLSVEKIRDALEHEEELSRADMDDRAVGQQPEIDEGVLTMEGD